MSLTSFFVDGKGLEKVTSGDLLMDCARCERLYTYMQLDSTESELAKTDLLRYMLFAFELGRYGRKLNI